MRTRTAARLALVSVATATFALGNMSTAAFADHVHVRVTGNGQCAVVAEAGGEKYVELPASVFEKNPNVDIAPAENRNHPLHVLAHQGQPAEAQPDSIYVYGSPAGETACAAGYVNR